MSVIFLFFYSCWLLFLDFLRIIARGFKKLFTLKPKQPTQKQSTLKTENESERAFNELLTLEELLEDDEK